MVRSTKRVRSDHVSYHFVFTKTACTHPYKKFWSSKMPWVNHIVDRTNQAVLCSVFSIVLHQSSVFVIVHAKKDQNMNSWEIIWYSCRALPEMIPPKNSAQWCSYVNAREKSAFPTATIGNRFRHKLIIEIGMFVLFVFLFLLCFHFLFFVVVVDWLIFLKE